MSCDTTSSGSLVEIFYLHFGFRTFGNSRFYDFLDLFGRVSLFGFLTQDFGGTSAFQQGDFDGRSLKETVQMIPFGFRFWVGMPGGFDLGLLLQIWFYPVLSYGCEIVLMLKTPKC
ncbi:hypothetical protein RIR_jg22064.t1 [Rhizophagus irregularis DAOM 181602=DAOM 197198]|nr:hypothetical protein RIR_jg22064.t1 [Rhizophagus irregularis DAOM 181602=DAOM 197198]